MCTTIFDLDSGAEIESPPELLALIRTGDLAASLVPAYPSGEIRDDCCLCQVDVEQTLIRAGFSYQMQRDDPMSIETKRLTLPAAPSGADTQESSA